MADFVLSTQDNSVSTTLPAPLPDIPRPAERFGAAHRTLNGFGVRFQGAVKRTYTLSWAGLTEAEWDTIEAWHLGTHGAGPFKFTWPGKTAVLVNIMNCPTLSANADAPASTAGIHGGSLALEEV